MTKGAKRARSLRSTGLQAGQTLTGALSGGGVQDLLRRSLTRGIPGGSTGSGSSTFLPGYGSLVESGTSAGTTPVDLTSLTPTVDVVPGVGFVVLDCPLDTVAAYPDTADKAIITFTDTGETPLVFPLRNGGGRGACPVLVTAGFVLDLATIAIPDAPGQAFNITFFFPTIHIAGF